MKLKLTYIPFKCVVANVPHYDLHEAKKKGGYSLACIVTDSKRTAAFIRKQLCGKDFKHII